ncbi:MAG: HAMP domain-containing protein [Deltaproteobacteria bacterium]|nr:HAMP domain-containing protein [Deltaproteobacteria bacterium]
MPRWFRNRNAATKMMLSFSLMALLIVVVGYQGVSGMGVIYDRLSEVYARHGLGLGHVMEAEIQALKVARTLRDALLEDNVAERQTHLNALKESRDAFFSALDAYQQTIVSRDDKGKEVDEVRMLFERLVAEQDKVLALAREGKDAEARAALRQLRPLADKTDSGIDALEAGKGRLMQDSYQAATHTYHTVRVTILAVMGVVVVLAFVIGYVLARMFAIPLAQGVAVLRKLASGDFTPRLPTQTTDEVGQMSAALNTTIEAMSVVLQEISQATEANATAAQQLATASGQLSSGFQTQASALEETAASMEEMTATVKQNADNARHAASLAIESRTLADTGGEVVAHTVDAMRDIATTSKRISDISSMIDEIAFQTNLLALNAAVEAARAGEQGRGFAVVATEVRNLAQRSAAAAKEIKGLIQESTQKVDNGVALVTQSGQTLHEIVGSVKRVNDMVTEIAVASQEQWQGIEQVNKTVAQMDTVTQSNAEQTEELSATAQALMKQAEQLQMLVGRFKLHEELSPEIAFTRIPSPPKHLESPRKAPLQIRVETPKISHRVFVNGRAKSPTAGFEEF